MSLTRSLRVAWKLVEEEMRYYHEQYPNLALETIEGYTFYWGEGLWQAVPSE